MGGVVNGMAGSLPTQQSIGNPYTPQGTGVNPNVPYGLQSSPMQGFGEMRSPYGGSYGNPYAMQSPYQQQSYGPPQWAQQQQNYGPSPWAQEQPPWAQQAQTGVNLVGSVTTPQGSYTPNQGGQLGQMANPGQSYGPFQAGYGGQNQQYRGWGGGDNWHHNWDNNMAQQQQGLTTGLAGLGAANQTSATSTTPSAAT